MKLRIACAFLTSVLFIAFAPLRQATAQHDGAELPARRSATSGQDQLACDDVKLARRKGNRSAAR